MFLFIAYVCFLLFVFPRSAAACLRVRRSTDAGSRSPSCFRRTSCLRSLATNAKMPESRAFRESARPHPVNRRSSRRTEDVFGKVVTRVERYGRGTRTESADAASVDDARRSTQKKHSLREDWERPRKEMKQQLVKNNNKKQIKRQEKENRKG